MFHYVSRFLGKMRYKLTLLFTLTSALVVTALTVFSSLVSLYQSPDNAEIVEEFKRQLKPMSGRLIEAYQDKAQQIEKLSLLVDSIYAIESSLSIKYQERYSYDVYISSILGVSFLDSSDIVIVDKTCEGCGPLVTNQSDQLVMQVKKTQKAQFDVDSEMNLVLLVYPVIDNNQYLGSVWIGVITPGLGHLTMEEFWVMNFNDFPETLLLGLLFGLIFGSLVSRKISYRLNNISHVVNAWSEGKLAIRIEDINNDELATLERQLNKMADELALWSVNREKIAVINERTFLARDLHDTAKQKIFSLQMQIASAQKIISDQSMVTVEPLGIAADLAEQAQQDLNDIILALRPVDINTRGLIPGVKLAIENWQKRSGIDTDVAIQDEIVLLPDNENILYKVLLEALANIERHSQATLVKITLKTYLGQVVLIIEDNGRGFEEQLTTYGSGLRNMRERVEENNGRFNLFTHVGGGTRLVIELISAGTVG